MKGHQLRDKRRAAGIAGSLLSMEAKVDRARLCNIEREYAEPSAAEIARLTKALDALILARQKVLSKLLCESG